MSDFFKNDQKIDLMNYFKMQDAVITQLLDSIPDLIFFVDLDGYYLGCNQEFARFVGKEKREIIGAHTSELFGKEKTLAFKKTEQLILTLDRPFHQERWLYYPDGSRVLADIVRAPLKDAEGKIIGIIGSSRNITDKKVAEQKLKEQLELHDLLFNNSINGFFFMMLDEPIIWNDTIDKEKTLDYVFKHQRVTKVNTAMLKQYRTTEAEFLGLVPNILFQHDLEKGREAWRKMFDEGHLYIDTLERRFDGTPMWVLGDYVCIYDFEGRITGHFGVQIDNTERKMAEEALIEAKKKAETANLAKTQFLANMSHEIRTPMNGILGFLQLLENSPLTEEQKNYLKHIKTSSKLLLCIIDDTLDASKLETKKLTLIETSFNFKETLEEIVLAFSAMALQKNIHLELQLKPDVPQNVIGDAPRLKQIIYNLLNNAIKFTENGEVILHAALAKKTDTNYEILIKISDTGIGIKDDDLNNLFEPFSQVENSSIRKYGGTGLGLTIAKSLIELMQGEITVESELDKGSTFIFTVNLKKDLKKLTGDKLTVEKNSFPVPLKSSNNVSLKILVAEDNELNYMLINEVLTALNQNSQWVINGEEAVKACLEENFDLIFMDCQMPVMDGYEATRQIRKVTQGKKHIPIIAMTAYAMKGDREKCLEAGMDEYLSKPLNIKQIASLISKYTN